MPYYLDRTGVRVMALCPGLTDTQLISEAHLRLLREDIGDEFVKEISKLPTQKWVYEKVNVLSYRIPSNFTFLHNVPVHF